MLELWLIISLPSFTDIPYYMRFRCLFIAFVICFPTTAMACSAGTYLEKKVGDFTAEMSYNAYRINPGQTVRFHFDLTNISNRSYGPGNPIDFDEVDAALRQDEVIVVTKSLHRENYEETAFDYAMPKKNTNYVMDVRFKKKGAILSSASFPLRAGWGSVWRNILSLGVTDPTLTASLTVRQE